MGATGLGLECQSRLDVLNQARARSDALFALLDPSVYLLRPIPLRHRVLFYLGHLEAFDFNHLVKAARPSESVEPAFDRLFERGIDPPAGSPPQDTEKDWPPLDEVAAYMKAARRAVDNTLDDAQPGIVDLIVEHRLMHVETLAYMLHELPGATKKPGTNAQHSSRRETPTPSRVDVPAGHATLGQMRGEAFGWDNEFDQHRVAVEPFAIDRYKVTNGEYLAYVESTGAEPPHFWRHLEDRWLWRGMFEEYPLPLASPVYVTQREATRYAAWKSGRLPTEAEFHRAAYGTPEGAERSYPWGEDPPTPLRTHADFAGFDPVDVDATPQGDSAFGAAQMVGNGWEWTSTPFAPFAGFTPDPNYPGYSADFFDGAHFVLKGGSPRTAAALLRRSFRNWFRPDYPYVYATFRCVVPR